MIFEGRIVKIYKQTDNWICFRFEDQKSKNQYTAKGKATKALMPEMKIQIEGEFVEDKKYGRQIDVFNIEIKSSVTATYLYKCIKGIGASLAEEIVKMYGEDCIEKINKDPHILLKVKGIKAKKLKMITESLKKADNMKLYLDIFSFFNNDITMNQADKIVQVCTSSKISFKKIKENPYWLISHIEGFGFKKVDRLALSSGLEEYSVERIGAAIVYCLQQMSQISGHCYCDMETLSKDVSELILGIPEDLTARTMKQFRTLIEEDNDKKIEDFINKKKEKGSLEEWKNNYYKLIDVMSEALINDIEEDLIVVEEEKIYWKELYEAENESAKIIAKMAWSVPVKNVSESNIRNAIEEVEEDEECKLSEEQKNAIIKSLSYRLSVITGGPGRGKTTIIKTIIKAWNDDKNIVLLAPTGKAAKRMTEASGYEASTIHRFRGKIGKEHLENKLIIVDETSMIGIKLGFALLKMSKDCNLVLVGDIDQLASIEPGSFMKDIIESGEVSVSYLTKGFRNGGSIAKNSDLVNQGKSLKNFILDKNTCFIKAEHENILKEVIISYKDLLKKYEASEIGILSPIRIRGFGSVDSINKMIREKINPETETNPQNGSGYLVNDRIMHIKNNYRKEIINEYGITELGIYNGDMGTISKIDQELEEVTVNLDDGRVGIFSFDEIKEEFEMAYAMTVHKSQGSEYKAVIIITTSQYAFFVKRNLLYTAFSRARDELRIIGDEKAIAIAVKNIDDSIRNTNLKERIRAYAKEI